MIVKSIPSRWFALHPTRRIDAVYWLAVARALNRGGIEVEHATDDQVRTAMKEVSERIAQLQDLAARGRAVIAKTRDSVHEAEQAIEALGGDV